MLVIHRHGPTGTQHRRAGGEDGRPRRTGTAVSDHPGDPSLGEYLLEWLERRASQLRPTTVDTYRRYITAYLTPRLGERRLSELDRRGLEAAYAALVATGGRSGGPLSPRTVQLAHAVLHRALQDAVIDGLLAANPARLARPPQRDPDADELTQGPRVWTGEQAAAFLSFVEGHPWRGLWHLALGTGARRGELLGLRWSDVDLEAGQIAVTRALTVVDGVPRLLTTKTATRRRLTIGPSVVEALREQAEAQERQRELAPTWQDRWGLVFTDGMGDPVDPKAVSREFGRLVRRAPVPVVRLHDLRHVHATLLLQRGVPMKVVSQRLGHTTIMMTVDVYGHVLPAMDAEAATEIEAAIHGSPRATEPR
jgi:integrase